MERRNFYLPKQQIEGLKKLSKQTGLSMSELLRRAIDNLLNSYVSDIQSQDNNRQENRSNP
ncbi:ribbon-helix-helix domain-containing protein [bacterium]|nr:ribbon-helix-helix domain-containing protein [bacterium]